MTTKRSLNSSFLFIVSDNNLVEKQCDDVIKAFTITPVYDNTFRKRVRLNAKLVF